MAGALNPLLGFAAGALTILSPCVLPLVPIVLGSALQKSRWGPLALSAGLVVSFTTIGMVVALLGVSTGLDSAWFARLGASLLIIAGLFLLSKRAQQLLVVAATPLANWANQGQDQLARYGLIGQAGIGVLLGLVWSPCIGPTLGVATILAAQGKSLVSAAIVMFSFALGVAVMLLILASATRTMLSRWRGRMLNAGQRGKLVLGGLLVIVGLMILSGVDHLVEGLYLQSAPEWLTTLTTKF